MATTSDERRRVARALAAGAVGLSIGLGGGVLLPALALADDGSTKVFDRTTASEDLELVVPAGTCSVKWSLVGGFGGDGLDGAVGGAPGHVVASTPATAGQTYLIGVGEPGDAAELETEVPATAGTASTVSLAGDPDVLILSAGGGKAGQSGHEANVVPEDAQTATVTTNDTFAGASADGSVVTADLIACPPVVAPQLISAAESKDAPGTVLVTFRAGVDETGTPADSYRVSTGLDAAGEPIWEALTPFQGDGTSTTPFVGKITRTAGEYQVVVQGVSEDERYSAASDPLQVTVAALEGGGNGGGPVVVDDGDGDNGSGEQQVAPATPTIQEAVSDLPGQVDLTVVPGQGDVAATGYEYSINGVEGTWKTLNFTTVDGSVRATVTELKEGVEYTFHVRALAGSGEAVVTSAASQPKTVIVKSAVPTPPKDEQPPVGDKPVEQPVGNKPVEQPPSDEKPAPPVVTPPVTPAPDADDQSEDQVVPVVPATVPDAPLTLTTDKGQITAVAPGEKLTIIGDGFKPGTNVSVIVYSEPQVLGTTLVGPDGTFRFEVTVPAGLPAGQHSLVASGTAPDGTERFLRMNVTVDAEGNATIDGNGDGVDDTLAYTGAEPLVPALLGAGALIGGAALLFVSRRRRTAQV